jgi:hypothetical protein
MRRSLDGILKNIRLVVRLYYAAPSGGKGKSSILSQKALKDGILPKAACGLGKNCGKRSDSAFP